MAFSSMGTIPLLMLSLCVVIEVALARDLRNSPSPFLSAIMGFQSSPSIYFVDDSQPSPSDKNSPYSPSNDAPHAHDSPISRSPYSSKTSPSENVLMTPNFGSSIQTTISASLSSPTTSSPTAKYSPFTSSPSTPKNSPSAPRSSFFTRTSPSSPYIIHFPRIELAPILKTSSFPPNVPSQTNSPSSPSSSTSPFPSSNAIESPAMRSPSSPRNNESPTMVALSSPSEFIRTPTTSSPSLVEMTPAEMSSPATPTSNSPSSPYSSPITHVQLNFTICNDKPMEMGQGFAVIGSIPELGDWRIYDAPLLEIVYNNVWSTVVNIRSKTSFEYKLVLVESGTKEALMWPEGGSYKYTIPDHTSYVVVNVPITSLDGPVSTTM